MAKTRFFDVVAARQHYQQANMLFRLLGNDTRAAAILLNSTILTLQVGLLEATRTTLHEARTIFEAAQDIRGQAICAINMSLVLQLEEKPAPALEEAQRGLALTEQIENDYLAATALSNISSSHMMLGNYQQAINFMQQALEMRCNQGAQEVSIIEELRDLALAHLDAGDVPQAQQTIDEMLARREKSTQPLSYESYCLWVAALVYRRNGNESRSDALLQTAYKTMQETADRIPDETTRQAFLDLFFHRRIQRAYHQGTWPE
jgi:tetratricopeptide (TPR) repeat protein